MLAQYFNYPRLVCAKTLRKALGSRLWEISFDQLGDFAHWPKKEALFWGETERNEKKKKGSSQGLFAWRKKWIVSFISDLYTL